MFFFRYIAITIIILFTEASLMLRSVVDSQQEKIDSQQEKMDDVSSQVMATNLHNNATILCIKFG
jgi:hypothetical protein